MARYVARVAQSISTSTPEVSSANAGRAAAQVANRVSGGLQKADLNKLNFGVPGNTSEVVKLVKFARADADVFVSHKLGFRVDNFEVISPDKPAKFYLGSKPPNIYGMWIKSDTAGVTARIRLYGQKKG